MKMTKFIAAFAAAFLLFGSANAFAAASSYEVVADQQQVRISGTVVDAQGVPVPGASVIIKGTSTGTMTDVKGNFSLNVRPGATLVVSCIGYVDAEAAAKDNVRIVLEEDAELLAETVVVGYGAQKKVNLTGAVSVVDAEKVLDSRPIPDVGRGLQGTTPGMTVQVGSSEVGSDARIRIRGQIGSIEGGAQPLILLDNVEIPSLNLVNPDDIESISVLKDAASASIYGAKAAFGVILITSKKGAKEQERVNVTYSGNVAFQSLAKKYEMADVEALHYWVESAERVGNYSPVGAFWVVDRAGYNAAVAWKEKYGKTLDPDAPMVYGRDWYIGSNGTSKIGVRTYDPYNYLIRKSAPAQTHNISVAGSKGKTNYNISLGYLNQKGMLKVTDYDYYRRYNANLRLDTQVNNWLNVHAGMMFTNSTKSWAFATSSTTADPWYYAFRWASNYPLVATDEYGNNMRNPVYELSEGKQATKETNYTSVNLGTTITPLKNWDIRFDYTFALNNLQERHPGTRFYGDDLWYGTPQTEKDASGNIVTIANEWAEYNGLGANINKRYFTPSDYYGDSYDLIYQDSYTGKRHTWNATTNYELNLADAHTLNFMLGMNIVGYTETGVWGQKKNLLDYNNAQFALATGTQTAGGGYAWNSTVGFFGRFNYNYKEKYLFEANLRRDGSSKFMGPLRWRWFPSASAGWRVTEEPWMQSVKPVMNFLKLRASWGMIGDQSVASSLYIPTIGALTQYWMLDNKVTSAYATPALVDSNITWQDIVTLDFGVDFSLFNQIDVTFDWYQRDTKNMIVPAEGLSYNIGSSAPKGNYGDLRTRGWELSVRYGKTFSNGLSLSATASLADAKTVVTNYGSAKGIEGWYNGKEYGEIWGYKVDRLFQNDDFAHDANGNLIEGKDKYGKIYVFADGKDYATQGRITSGSLISGPGDVKFVDLNGDGVIDYGSKLIEDADGNPAYGDYTRIGNTTPRYEYSLMINGDYKGFDFSVFFQGVGKRDMLGSSWTTIPGFSSGDGGMAATFANDFWYETKDANGNVIDANYDAFYPRAANCGRSLIFNMVPSDRYMLNMAYFRIKNITLGYTLPKTLTQKASISKARLYVSLENFFTFDHLNGLPVDPEEIAGYSSFNSSNYNSGFAGVGAPAYKSASFGVQVTF